MKDLFEKNAYMRARFFKERPLAWRMRPRSLDEFAGQGHILSSGSQLRTMIEAGKVFSVIFHGPPGCGKTALASIIASVINAEVEKLNAVSSGVRELRQAVLKGQNRMNSNGTKTLLIVDEFHRFSRVQQEALLPDVEEGNISLAGITTENPYYFIVGPLLSRASVFEFKPLDRKDIVKILEYAVKDKERGLGRKSSCLEKQAAELIARKSAGDARYALNILETASASNPSGTIDCKTVELLSSDKKLIYDRTGDQHYDTISAFIKSMRGSDPDAAVYYLAKMISSGEDERFIARRIAICASEDVGNADPQALLIASAALDSVEKVGFPEAGIILAQAAVYIATAPKSNASYMALNRASKDIEKGGSFSVPGHLTKRGADRYLYPHDFRYGHVRQKYMSEDKNFYSPSNRGHEKYIRRYMKFIKENSEK